MHPWSHGLQMLAFFEARYEDLLLVKLRHYHYCCGQRRQLSGATYRCRSATCFIQACVVMWWDLMYVHGWSCCVYVVLLADMCSMARSSTSTCWTMAASVRSSTFAW